MSKDIELEKKKEPLRNGLVGDFLGYRIHGKTYDVTGIEFEEEHEADCVCCRKNLMNTPNLELERIKITFEIGCLRGLDTSRKARIKYALDTALQTYAKQEVQKITQDIRNLGYTRYVAQHMPLILHPKAVPLDRLEALLAEKDSGEIV